MIINLNQRLLYWLVIRNLDESVFFENGLLMDYLLPYQCNIYQAAESFVIACRSHANDLSVALTSIMDFDARYQALLPNHRKHLEAYHVVSSAYLAHYQPSPKHDQERSEALANFAAPRQGRLPRWISDTLQRLDITPQT